MLFSLCDYNCVVCTFVSSINMGNCIQMYHKYFNVRHNQWNKSVFFYFFTANQWKWTPVIKVKIFVNTYDLMFHSFALINVFNIYLSRFSLNPNGQILIIVALKSHTWIFCVPFWLRCPHFSNSAWSVLCKSQSLKAFSLGIQNNILF